ncbi:MAG: hypothetical protein HC852_14525, partial [Acaryochloridaceae cyanobacterium RU_4_10]|nr:hypothetical protein [Acaryochloridaceae cyanobacterium RU_4_10]
MATLSSLRSRRFANRVAEATVQLIAFRLRQDWFALPMDAVQRVASARSGDSWLFQSGNAPGVRISSESGVTANLVDLQGLNIIDVDQRIFAADVSPDRADLLSESQQDHCFIILRPQAGETFGLP